MEKSGYRCAKCSKQVLHRRQLTKWGNQYWCEHCVQDHIASFKKEPMNTLEQAWNELQAVPSYVEVQARQFVEEVELGSQPKEVATYFVDGIDGGMHEGECVVCDRVGLLNSFDACEGCVMEAMIG